MVRSCPRLTLLLGVLLFASLAGCIGSGTDESDSVDPPTETLTSVAPSPSIAPPTATKKNEPLVEVGDEEAIFAPEWQVGDWWRFDVSGSARPTATVTLKVIEVAADHYKLAADDDTETIFNRLHDGPWIPRNSTFGIHKDTLAFHGDGDYQDYLGFLRPVGASWTVNLHGSSYTISKAVQEFTGFTGATSGLVLTGPALNQNTIVIEYDPQVRWLNRMVVANATGATIFSYTLVGHGSGDGPTVRVWRFIGGAQHDAQSPAYPVGYIGPEDWDSNGTGDELYIVFHLISRLQGGMAYASVLPPLAPEPFSETVEQGEEWFYIPTDDAEGKWWLAPATVGGNAAAERAYAYIYVFQAKVTEA